MNKIYLFCSMYKDCPCCGGTGDEGNNDTGYKPCRYCGGSGTIPN